MPLGQELLELRLGSALRVPGCFPPFGRSADALVDPRQIECCDSSLERGDLTAQLLDPCRGAGLECERAKSLLDLGLDVPRPGHVLPDARQLQLCTVTAPLELPEPSGLLHERAALLGLRGEDLLDLALRDHRARRAAETDVRKQLDEVGAANRSPVDQVLALAAPMEAAHDRDFGRQVSERVVRVIEHQLDLAERHRLATARAREEHVVRLLGAQLVRRHASGGPEERVGHIRLPGAVRPDDHGNARLEANLDRFREGLEAADADCAQMHAGPTLVSQADGANR